jgi:hypothetical protein
MKKRVYMRIGLPGAGKSSGLEPLRAACGMSGLSLEIHSTDEFFVDSWGKYQFDFRKLAEYHELNKAAFTRSLETGKDVVVVDNTNLRRVHREAYRDLADEFDYDVIYQVVGSFGPKACMVYANRNTHGVPLGTIVRMAQQFEPVTEEEMGEG